MKKQCKQCSIEFEPITKKGSEQLYCSQICRSRAASERFKQKLINSNNYENNYNQNRGHENSQRIEKNQTINDSVGVGNYQTESRTFTPDNFIHNRYYRELTPGNYGGIDQFRGTRDFDRYIELIEENAKLRAEQIILKEKIFNLESELTEIELEEDMEEEESPGFLGNIMNAYKQDPTTTVLFAKDMIFEFLKPKNNEQYKTPNPKANG